MDRSALPGEAELPTLDDDARLLAVAQDRLDRLAAPFVYRNTRGRAASLPLWAALRHVVNHASYHRGQVASKLKRFGVEPPVTSSPGRSSGLRGRPGEPPSPCLGIPGRPG